MTFRQTLAHPLLPLFKGAFLFALTAACVGILSLTGTFDMPEKATDAEMMETRPAAIGSPAALVEAHDCWTGEAPAGVTPAGVIVTIDNVTSHRGERAVGMALQQIFDGIDHGMTVVAFCSN